MRLATVSASVVAACVLALAACDSTTPPPPPPAAVAPSEGDVQAGTVGQRLPVPLAVLVTDERGRPVAGVDVQWTITAGGGTLDPPVSRTGQDGRAFTNWTLGPLAGEQRVTATVAGLGPVEFRATAAAGPVARVVLTPDSVVLNAIRDTADFQVRQLDAFGNFISNHVHIELLDLTGVLHIHATIPVRLVGMATGVGRFEARVPPGGPNLADTGVVVVRQVPAAVQVAPSDQTLAPGDTSRLVGFAQDSNGVAIPGARFTWSTNAPGVVTVDSAGLLTAMADGSARITATLAGLSAGADVAVAEPLHAASVSTGLYSTCALTAAAAAYCWGSNHLGGLGTGAADAVAHPAPEPVGGGHTWASLSVGREHACALTPAGTAYCWGGNRWGELGVASTGQTCGTGADVVSCSPLPMAVPGVPPFQEISAGGGFTCAVTAGGAAYCWGNNVFGQVGDGTLSSTRPPAPVSGGLSFATITSGGNFACALDADGDAYCWGRNGSGEIGAGLTPQCPDFGASDCTPVPVAVDGGLKFAGIDAGEFHACARTAAGAAHCWGQNNGGQLGNGTHAGISRVPVAVVGGHTFASVRTGNSQSCGVAAGVAYCWGRNREGALGTGAPVDSVVSSPMRVAGTMSWTGVDASERTCGVAVDGRVYCWGSNTAGALGNGSTSPPYRLTPAAVVAPPGGASATAGSTRRWAAPRGPRPARRP